MRLTRPDLIGTLRSLVEGAVLLPGDPGYDQARTPFFAHRTAHPIAVVRPKEAADVAATVRVAAGSDTPLFVRGGGHTTHSTGDGLLLDLGNLTDLDVDAADRSCWAGGGFTAGALTRNLGGHGLAVGFGDTPSTGIGGLTLGGGIGFLARRHGLTVDNLLAAEIVTADGHIRLVDADRDPDLFWAIRGGGSSFGIVTRFRYRLAALAQVYGGLLVLPATPQTIAATATACAEAGRGLTVIANIMPAPARPGVPPEAASRPVLVARVCFAGPGDPEDAVRPLRRIAPPLLDQLQPMPYPALLAEETPDRGMRPALQTLFLDAVDESTGTVILDHLSRGRSLLRLVQLRVLGGAVSDIAADQTAYAHRDAPYLATAIHGDHPDYAWADGWTRSVAQNLPHHRKGVYLNFAGLNDTAQLTAAFPPPTLTKLHRIKAVYDPTNLFCHNANITPEAAAA